MAVSGIKQGDLLGVITGTLAKYPFEKTFQVFNLSSYPNLELAQRRRKSTDGGKTQNFFVNRGGQGNFRWVRPWDRDSTKATDNFIEGSMKMCFNKTHYAFDKKEEDLNKGASRLVSVVKERRITQLKDMCDGLETALMGVQDTADDDLRPAGFPQHFLLGPTGSYTDGFVGQTVRYGNHASGAAVTGTITAGIDRSTAANSKLRNWAGIYDKVDQSLIRQIRSALTDTRIKPPMLLSQEMVSRGEVVRFYFPKDPYLQVCDLLDSKNNNWGRDLGGGGMKSVFGNAEIVHNPVMDPTDSSDTHYYRTVAKPIYCINHADCETLTLRDRWVLENPPMQDPNNHDGVIVWIDGSMQMLVPNWRYAGFVLHKQLSY